MLLDKRKSSNNVDVRVLFMTYVPVLTGAASERA